MGKKRLRSEEVEEEVDRPRSKKARELLWKVPEALDKQAELCATLFNALRKCKDSDNRSLSDFLMRAPSRRLLPTYYETITQPIDLMKIQQKVKTDEYHSVTSFLSDVHLLLDNVRQFYPSTSDECQMVDQLEAAFTQILIEHGFGTSSSSRETWSDSDSIQSPTNLTLRIPKVHLQLQQTKTHGTSEAGHRGSLPGTSASSSRGKVTRSQAWMKDYLASDDPIKKFLAAVYDYHDPVSGDFVAEAFHQLPSPADYPEYYEVITQPIDLNTMRKNTEANKYSNLKAIQDDMIVMIKNAHHFNEPGSDIYKMASMLRKFIILRCSELEKKYQTVTKTTTKVVLKSPLDVVGDAKKVPRLKISLNESSKGQKPSTSSISDTEDAPMESSDDELSSDEEESSTGKLLLQIKKEKISGTPHSLADPVAKLLQAKKPPLLKKRLMALYRSLVNKTDSQGRVLSELFKRRPSHKLYPEYYMVIKEPIDLKEILGKIKMGKYTVLREMGADVELMVSNALTFNEEHSQVYNDALVLREVARTAIQRLEEGWLDTSSPSLSATPIVQQHPQRGRPRKVPAQEDSSLPSTTPPDVMGLFHALKYHTDHHGRHLWLTFKALPPTGVSSTDYFAGKRPMDVNTVHNKIVTGQYHNLDQIFDDLTLMNDNAFSFFPQHSQQYQDAIALQRVIISKYTQLKGAASDKHPWVPDISLCVQKILSEILSRALYSKEVSDKLRGVVATREVELQDEEEGVVTHSFNLDNIEKWMAKREYQRLDQFHMDLLALLKQASKEGKWGVAGEVGRRYLATRDELCGEGKNQLWSPVLAYSAQDLESDLERASCSQSPPNSPGRSRSCSDSLSPNSIPNDGIQPGHGAGVEWEWEGDKKNEQSVKCEWAGVDYHAGDVVYVKSSNPDQQNPHIVMIEKFWKDSSNSMCFDGTWYYRPEETFHGAKRKFYDKEVFRSDFHGVARMLQVVSKCCILFIKDFPKFFPQGFAPEDVYVCESRYSYKTKSFKKIRNWTWPGSSPTLHPRATPLVMTRIPSVFIRGERNVGESSDGNVVTQGPLDTSFIGLSQTNVLVGASNPDSPCTYYQQFCIDEAYFKLGDCVYLRSDKENPFIARIERIWTDANGDPWIYGPWFLRPKEVNHSPTRTFYQQELLLSNIQDSNPMRSISGKCIVLSPQDYCKKRPVGFAEEDVYVIQSRYNEAEKEIKRLKGLKSHQYSSSVIPDEFYYLGQELQLVKVASPKLFTKEFNPAEPPVKSKPNNISSIPGTSGVSPLSTGGKAGGGINITPQLIQQLLASASKISTTRPVVIPLQPSSLTSTTTTATITSATQLTQTPSKAVPAQIAGSVNPSPISQQNFPCLWTDCSEAFQGPVELYTHVVGPSPSHLSKEREGSYYCRWKNCPRNPSSGGRPFDAVNKIIRHMKEVHLMKLSTLFGIGGSRSSYASRGTPTQGVVQPTTPLPPSPTIPPAPIQLTPKIPPLPTFSVSPATQSQTTSIKSTTPPKTTKPQIFLPPPENRQKLVHSDIYLRYIQGIRNNSRYLSSHADSAEVRTHQTQTVVKPEDWFSSDELKEMEGGASKPGSGAIVDALWALRDHMNNESRKISSYLEKHS